jgi:uncharacterized protein (DUF305 family)
VVNVNTDDHSPTPGSVGGSEPPDHGGDADDEVLELPWYYSWWRVALLSVAATVAAVGLVMILTEERPDTDSVDVGFLQDMRSHHDQAVRMSLAFLFKPDGVDPILRTIAGEILLSQQQETGIMVEILRGFGTDEENSSGTAMAWMNEPVPLERMPGLASEAELDRLDAAQGSDADQLFIDLMIAHHEGGVHMAEYAADRAETGRVRSVARAMARVQQEEIDELRAIDSRLEAGS